MRRVLFLYHFLPPDSVVSAVHFGQLAEGLAARGWMVEGWPSNRVRRRPAASLPARGGAPGIALRRVWRPPLSQDASGGRIANTAWMIGAWAVRCLQPRSSDVVVIGSAPPLGCVIAPLWKALHRNSKVVHWCFDLYPDAAVSHGWLREGGAAERLLRRLSAWGLGACDAVVDIGPGMQRRIALRAPYARQQTLVPWSLVDAPTYERPDHRLRTEMFGQADVALLYAGRLGRAYGWERFVEIADAFRSEGVVVGFQSIGERERDIRNAARALPNVRFFPGCSESELLGRLRATDFHLVSLRSRWSGVVVPSKFFAALSAGRPVLYDGPRDSDVAEWIRAHDVGVVLPDLELTRESRALLRQAFDRVRDGEWGRKAWETGRALFGRDSVTDGWDRLLRLLIDARADEPIPCAFP